MEQWASEKVSSAALEQFFQRLQEHGTQLHALEIFERGQCLVRWGVAPYRCSDQREVYSLSKSFAATAVGLAFDRGLLHPDDLLSRYFPQQTAAQRDPRWRRVRLRHLLSMTVGHGACPMPQMAFAPDAVQAFFAAPLEFEPGEHFAYSTGASCILAEVVRRATGTTVPDLLARELFGPMGIKEIAWDSCADGRCQGGTGLKASCDDVAKLGLLYCAGGVWQGRRLLSQQWVEMATCQQAVNSQNGTPDWCAGYGFQFWRNKEEGFRGDGAFGQLCVVLPKRELVVAVMAESTDMAAELDILWELLRGLHSGGPGQGLPPAYAPQGALADKEWDSGWLDCGENPMGFTAMRAWSAQGRAALSLCDGSRCQTLELEQGRWTHNRLWAKQLRPSLYRQMPRTGSQLLLLEAAAGWEGDVFVLECRMRNTPHSFCWRLCPVEGGVQVRLSSALDVFGTAGSWDAGGAVQRDC